MNHTIEIPDSVFSRLQSIATPLIDEPASVIERVLCFYETHAGKGTSPSPAPSISPTSLEFDAGKAPDLHHTRILDARIEGRTAHTWNELTRSAHALAIRRGHFGNIGDLRNISGANLFGGERHDRGFHPIDGAGISIQGVDANNAWQHALKLAKHLGVALEVEFEWHNKPAAEHPGARARMTWSP